MTVARDILDESVMTLLEDEMPTRTGTWVGLCDPPNPPIVMPYLILYPMMPASTGGDMQDGESQRDFLYQVTCVGNTPKQTAWASSKSQAIMVGRPNDGSSGYSYVLAPVGIDVHYRVSDSLGGVQRSGDRLYKSDDVYRIRASG